MLNVRRSRNWLFGGLGALALAATATGCGAAAESELERGEEPQAAAEALTTSLTVQQLRRLVLTNTNDSETLANFSLINVMKQIISRTPNITPLTARALYRQMFDTMNAPPIPADPADVQHCSDTFNGFDFVCPRNEGILATTDPFVTATPDDKYTPTALVNRFDLAPSDGSDCGEYRIVYAKHTSGALDRNFLIFEGRLPNPSPQLGIQGCRPVAQMWADLSKNSSATSRASIMKSFFFTGLTSGGITFAPVIDPTHYGMPADTTPGAPSLGQIRVNLFMPSRGSDSNFTRQFWQLREFHVQKDCSGGSAGAACSLRMNPVTVKNNPAGVLFKTPDPQEADPVLKAKQEAFQTVDFIAMVKELAQSTDIAPDASLIGMDTPDEYNSGESFSDGRQDYLALASGNDAFKTAIENRLGEIGSTLKPDDILARATTQSCGGCHQQSNGANVGGGVVFPQSNGFTQIDENGKLSDAMLNVFLPHRKQVLDTFLASPPPAPSVVSFAASRAAQAPSDGVLVDSGASSTSGAAQPATVNIGGNATN